VRSGDRPRILEVLFSFRVGGSEVVGLELAHQLAGQGAEVMCTAVEGVDGPLGEHCSRLGLKVIDLGFPVRGPLERNGFSLALTRRLRRLRLDAMHLQHFLSLLKLGVPGRLAGVPRIVVTEHTDAPLRERPDQRRRVRLTWRLAHRITVIHPEMAGYFTAQIGIPSSRIAVIPNGIDAARWHRTDRDDCRTKLGLGAEFAFVFAGRLEAVKNVPDLIRAFLRVQPRFPHPARLIIVGGGTEYAQCRAILDGHERGAEAVLLAGEQLDIRRYLAAADAFVMNSRSEGVPRALLEAMCMGLPAISTAVGGIPGLLGGRGWLTRPDDPQTLEGAMLDAVTSPQKSAELGERARAHVAAEYDHRSVVRSYENVLYNRNA
jgi:glycosyltransferase involved in cell wall biosynthesis